MAESPTSTTPRPSCPGCGEGPTERFIELHDLPVHAMAVYPTPEEAAAVHRADQVLALCGRCGLIFNEVFDLGLLDYAGHHEDSQHHSPRFAAYARQTAEDLVARYDLQGTTVVEVGCGKAGFLVELLHAGVGTAVGVDPGFRPDHVPADVADRLVVHTELYEARHIPPGAAAVVCRHTLEHIPEPTEFVADMVDGMRKAGTGWFFAEVPDVGRILQEGAFWDLQYEHCSYFTPVTFAAMLGRAGLEPVSSHLDFGDQYVVAESRLSDAAGGPSTASLDAEIARLRELSTQFGAAVRASFERWSAWFAEQGADREVVVWGGGSKGLTFLNTLRPEGVRRIVDINPGLQGNFIGGRALPIVPPDALRDDPPATVLLMNPIYLDEVRAMLDDLGLQSTELLAV